MATKKWTGIALALVLGVAVRTQATVVLSTAEVQGGSGGGAATVNPGVATIEIQGNSARAFTNAYAVNAGPGTPTDPNIPAVPGLGIGVGLRAVTANLIQTYKDAGNSTTVPNVSYNGGNNTAIVAVTALTGYVQAINGTAATAFFTSGLLNFYSVDVGGPNKFDPDDPSTWGVFDSSGLAVTPIATFTLLAPDDIVDGLAGNATIFTSSQVNRSVADSNGNGTDGNLLFGQKDGVGVSSTILNKEFVNVPDFDNEILFAQIRQSLNNPAARQVNQSDLDLFNKIAGQFGLSNLGGAGTAFATGLGGLSSSTNYAATPDSSGILDIATNFDGIPSNQGQLKQVRPGYQITPNAVPEPGTLASAALASLAGLVWMKRRKAA